MNKYNKNKLYLVFLCIFIIQIFTGYFNSSNQNGGSEQTRVTSYIADNFNRYKDIIKTETGVEGKIVNEEEDGKEQKYIEFDINDITKVKFEANDIDVIITKQCIQSNEPNVTNPKKELKVEYIGIKEDGDVITTLTYKDGGFYVVDYKVNDFEHPLDDHKEKYEHNDLKIKSVASAEELKQLNLKIHSIYNVFENIYNEYNAKNKQ